MERKRSCPQAVFNYNRDVWWRLEEFTRAELPEVKKLWKKGAWKRMFKESVDVPHCPRELMLGESRILKVIDAVRMEDKIMVHVTPLAVLGWPALESHPRLFDMAWEHCCNEDWEDFFFWY